MRPFAVILSVASVALAGPAVARACDASPEANRRLVLDFYTLGLVERQPHAAFERYVAPDFVEHKPDIPGGTRDATAEFLAGIIRDVPEARWEVLRSAAQDDLVFVHARMTPAPGAGAYALADIFRVERTAASSSTGTWSPVRSRMRPIRIRGSEATARTRRSR